MPLNILQEGRFKYCEEGNGHPIILLHGLFGALSNFNDLIDHFKPNYRVAIPLLPLYELELDQTTVTGMVNYIEEFVQYKGYESVSLIGNSLGGHVSLLFTLKNPEKVKTLTLTGSSGLFENSLGDTYPRKGDYEYIKKKTQETFYDPNVASKELVDEVFDICNDRNKAIRIVVMAKSALRHNLREEVHKIACPVNLIWGADDTVTPSFVGEEFNKLIPQSELHIIKQCGHAAMMEKPEEFNGIMERFLTLHLQNNG
jgi:2-hydroxy-6-oxonona-2,4-dienedioate hydrolase